MQVGEVYEKKNIYICRYCLWGAPTEDLPQDLDGSWSVLTFKMSIFWSWHHQWLCQRYMQILERQWQDLSGHQRISFPVCHCLFFHTVLLILLWAAGSISAVRCSLHTTEPWCFSSWDRSVRTVRLVGMQVFMGTSQPQLSDAATVEESQKMVWGLMMHICPMSQLLNLNQKIKNNYDELVDIDKTKISYVKESRFMNNFGSTKNFY